MNKIEVSLENCFGIRKFNHTFDFSDSSVKLIYARNGLMKTSFSRTFQKLQANKTKEIQDLIFGIEGTADVKVDGKEIKSKQIYVAKSLDTEYESNVAQLLINDSIKEKIEDLLKVKNEFFKKLEGCSGLKQHKVYRGEETYEIEDQISQDFGLETSSLLLNLDKINLEDANSEYEDVVYIHLFDESALKKIQDVDFQASINDYIKEIEEIYKSFTFLESGKLTLPKLIKLSAQLENYSYFTKDNKLVLTGEVEIKDIDELNEKISEIKNKLSDAKKITNIEKLWNDTKGITLKDEIEKHQDIIVKLIKENIPELRKILWATYINKFKGDFENLCEKSNILKEELKDIDKLDNDWNGALEIFNNRFNVPFQMEISNVESAIIGENIPKIMFKFESEEKTEALNRKQINSLSILSQGEQRALYLLNIIFDIYKIRKSDEECLLIFDDIADSFDYKNKYAIIEYLYELSHDPQFKLIILTHNFDFLRSVFWRLGVGRCNTFEAYKGESNEIKLWIAPYLCQPINNWKDEFKINTFLASVSFLREIIHISKDSNVIMGMNGDFDIDFSNDYNFLTSIFHYKNGTKEIKIKHLKPLFKNYFDGCKFNEDINKAEEENIFDKIINSCNEIDVKDTSLEAKIVLSMGIRLIAEEYMINYIEKWNKEILFDNVAYKNGMEFLESTALDSYQTRKLFECYSSLYQKNKEILRNVCLMTPESIHVNSFMYEPLIDMDIKELKSLYEKVIKM